MRILCTGGAGYVGSACLRWLLAHGHEAFAFDNLSEGNRAAVPDYAQRLIVGELIDTDLLIDTLRTRSIDAVMHFAALASVPDSISDPSNYYRVNVLGTYSLLEAMRAAGVKKLVFSSTAATYGFHGPEAMPLQETAAKNPETPYGTTKRAGEWMIADYARAYGWGYAIFRYFNAAGADPDGNHGEHRRHESHLIPLTLAVAVGKRPALKIFGDDYPTRDGTCVRDYVHTSDLAQAHQRAVERLEPGYGEAFNLGSGEGATVKEVHAACERAVGRSIPVEYAPRRPGDPAVLVADPAKAIRELGWTPCFSDIATIVRTAWQWHSRHPDGYPD
jgi:UDP-glucose-4-epimerase GalE